MFVKWGLILMLLASASSAYAQNQVKVYSWVDSSGRQHYSDRPPLGVEMKPRSVVVSKPSTPVSSSVSTMPADKTSADQMIADQRAKDCEVAKNNLTLLNDPNRQIVNQADPEAKPLDEAGKTRARALAESQVRDFCTVR